MFKKNVAPSSNHQLSGKDVKEASTTGFWQTTAPPMTCHHMLPRTPCQSCPSCLPHLAVQLKKTLQKQYPQVPEAQLAALLPTKASLTMTKLTNRAVVWSMEGGNPLFFDPDGRGVVLPTVRHSLATAASQAVQAGV